MVFLKNISLKFVHVGLLVALSLAPSVVAQSQQPTVASNQKSILSPSVDAGSYIYISAQDARSADGSLPATFREQVLQALTKLKAVVQSSGLTIDHVVYTQVYLEDMNHVDEMDRVFGEFFGKTPPARAVLGVARVPSSSIQINAVAVRDLTERRAIYPANVKTKDSAAPGVLTHDRLFISSMPGSTPENGNVPAEPAAQVDLALDRMQAVLQAAGLDFRNMVFVNPYLTTEIPSRLMNERYARRFEFGNTPARATIEVSSLPGGAHIEYTGVAVRDLALRKAVRPKNMPPSPTARTWPQAGSATMPTSSSIPSARMGWTSAPRTSAPASRPARATSA